MHDANMVNEVKLASLEKEITFFKLKSYIGKSATKKHDLFLARSDASTPYTVNTPLILKETTFTEHLTFSPLKEMMVNGIVKALAKIPNPSSQNPKAATSTTLNANASDVTIQPEGTAENTEQTAQAEHAECTEHAEHAEQEVTPKVVPHSFIDNISPLISFTTVKGRLSRNAKKAIKAELDAVNLATTATATATTGSSNNAATNGSARIDYKYCPYTDLLGSICTTLNSSDASKTTDASAKAQASTKVSTLANCNAKVNAKANSSLVLTTGTDKSWAGVFSINEAEIQGKLDRHDFNSLAHALTLVKTLGDKDRAKLARKLSALIPTNDKGNGKGRGKGANSHIVSTLSDLGLNNLCSAVNLGVSEINSSKAKSKRKRKANATTDDMLNDAANGASASDSYSDGYAYSDGYGDELACDDKLPSSMLIVDAEGKCCQELDSVSERAVFALNRKQSSTVLVPQMPKNMLKDQILKCTERIMRTKAPKPIEDFNVKSFSDPSYDFCIAYTLHEKKEERFTGFIAEDANLPAEDKNFNSSNEISLKLVEDKLCTYLPTAYSMLDDFNFNERKSAEIVSYEFFKKYTTFIDKNYFLHPVLQGLNHPINVVLSGLSREKLINLQSEAIYYLKNELRFKTYSMVRIIENALSAVGMAGAVSDIRNLPLIELTNDELFRKLHKIANKYHSRINLKEFNQVFGKRDLDEIPYQAGALGTVSAFGSLGSLGSEGTSSNAAAAPYNAAGTACAKSQGLNLKHNPELNYRLNKDGQLLKYFILNKAQDAHAKFIESLVDAVYDPTNPQDEELYQYAKAMVYGTPEPKTKNSLTTGINQNETSDTSDTNAEVNTAFSAASTIASLLNDSKQPAANGHNDDADDAEDVDDGHKRFSANGQAILDNEFDDDDIYYEPNSLHDNSLDWGAYESHIESVLDTEDDIKANHSSTSHADFDNDDLEDAYDEAITDGKLDREDYAIEVAAADDADDSDDEFDDVSSEESISRESSNSAIQGHGLGSEYGGAKPLMVGAKGKRGRKPSKAQQERELKAAVAQLLDFEEDRDDSGLSGYNIKPDSFDRKLAQRAKHLKPKELMLSLSEALRFFECVKEERDLTNVFNIRANSLLEGAKLFNAFKLMFLYNLGPLMGMLKERYADAFYLFIFLAKEHVVWQQLKSLNEVRNSSFLSHLLGSKLNFGLEKRHILSCLYEGISESTETLAHTLSTNEHLGKILDSNLKSNVKLHKDLTSALIPLKKAQDKTSLSELITAPIKPSLSAILDNLNYDTKTFTCGLPILTEGQATATKDMKTKDPLHSKPSELEPKLYRQTEHKFNDEPNYMIPSAIYENYDDDLEMAAGPSVLSDLPEEVIAKLQAMPELKIQTEPTPANSIIEKGQNHLTTANDEVPCTADDSYSTELYETADFELGSDLDDEEFADDDIELGNDIELELELNNEQDYAEIELGNDLESSIENEAADAIAHDTADLTILTNTNVKLNAQAEAVAVKKAQKAQKSNGKSIVSARAIAALKAMKEEMADDAKNELCKKNGVKCAGERGDDFHSYHAINDHDSRKEFDVGNHASADAHALKTNNQELVVVKRNEDSEPNFKQVVWDFLAKPKANVFKMMDRLNFVPEDFKAKKLIASSVLKHDVKYEAYDSSPLCRLALKYVNLIENIVSSSTEYATDVKLNKALNYLALPKTLEKALSNDFFLNKPCMPYKLDLMDFKSMYENIVDKREQSLNALRSTHEHEQVASTALKEDAKAASQDLELGDDSDLSFFDAKTAQNFDKSSILIRKQASKHRLVNDLCLNYVLNERGDIVIVQPQVLADKSAAKTANAAANVATDNVAHDNSMAARVKSSAHSKHSKAIKTYLRRCLGVKQLPNIDFSILSVANDQSPFVATKIAMGEAYTKEAVDYPTESHHDSSLSAISMTNSAMSSNAMSSVVGSKSFPSVNATMCDAFDSGNLTKSINDTKSHDNIKQHADIFMQNDDELMEYWAIPLPKGEKLIKFECDEIKNLISILKRSSTESLNTREVKENILVLEDLFKYVLSARVRTLASNSKALKNRLCDALAVVLAECPSQLIALHLLKSRTRINFSKDTCPLESFACHHTYKKRGRRTFDPKPQGKLA